MDSDRDLQLLLLAFRDRVVDPGRLAEAADSWVARRGTSLMSFLAARGVITPDDLDRLQAVTIDDPGPPPADTPPRQSLPGDIGDQAVTTLPVGPTDTPTPGRAPGTAGPVRRYELIRLHQTGGLGRVWLARDTAVGREVALKTLRPEYAGGRTARERFVREARVTGQLEHPSIVPLYDLAEGDDPYYVMRFVSGRTLSDAAADYHRRRAEGSATPLDLNSLLDAFVNVCRAVAFAHAREILHRDLKGQNIMVGDYGEVFLLDWGLAKRFGDADDPAVGGPGGEGGELTVPGAMVGTPAFMAPEVAAGGVATKASDVYGLGAILYSLLAGRGPYTGANAAAVVRRVVTDDPPPVTAANPAAPAGLVAVCRRAMARDPAGRYTSADEVATEVRRWLADEPVAAYPEPFGTRAARWARRRKTAVVAAAVLLATGAVASTAAAGLLFREEQKTRFAWEQAEQEKGRATESSDTAIAVVHELSEWIHLDQTAGNRPKAETDQSRVQTVAAGLTAYKRLMTVRPEDLDVRLNVARMYRYRANVARTLNQTADAESAYAEAARRFKELMAFRPGHLGQAEEYSLLERDYGLFLKNLGRLQEARAVMDRSMQLFDDLRRQAPTNLDFRRTQANLLIDRSDLESQLGRFAESEQAARASMELYEQLAKLPGVAPPLDPMYRSMAELRLAMALRESGRIEEAMTHHDGAVARLAAMPPGRDPLHQLYRARTERAWTWSQVPEKRRQAVADLDAARLGWEKLAGDFNLTPFYVHWQAVARLYRARINVVLDDRGAAKEDLGAAVKLLVGLVAKYPEYPDYQRDLGRAYKTLGDLAADDREVARWHAKARDLLEAALKRVPENIHFRRAAEELNAVPAARP
jgi:tRNA A-37 threonylcarbamoyl transferase component Bud32/tetratricopeptide (TPR) repeat protein